MVVLDEYFFSLKALRLSFQKHSETFTTVYFGLYALWPESCGEGADGGGCLSTVALGRAR